VGDGLQREIGKRQAFACLEQEAYLNLWRTQSVLSGDFARLFRGNGLNESSYNALRILRWVGSQGCSCGTIGSMLVARVPDVTRIINRLVRDGLATRLRSAEDRRVVRVAITTTGLERLSKLDEEVLALHRRQLGHLPQADLEALCRLLETARYRPVSYRDKSAESDGSDSGEDA
jgi:DNA-binding MarR family transcriptional regulator